MRKVSTSLSLLVTANVAAVLSLACTGADNSSGPPQTNFTPTATTTTPDRVVPAANSAADGDKHDDHNRRNHHDDNDDHRRAHLVGPHDDFGSNHVQCANLGNPHDDHRGQYQRRQPVGQHD